MIIIKTCRHLMPTGRTCQSAAMRGSAYCHHHDPKKSRRRNSRPVDPNFEIEHILEPASIPVAVNQILSAMAANRISNSKAAIMFQGLNTVLASYRMPSPDGFDDSLNFPEQDPRDAAKREDEKNKLLKEAREFADSLRPNP